jgi:hypothetical protein
MNRKIFTGLALSLAATTLPAGAKPLPAICHGEYALCASSSTIPIPGKTITVKGVVFPAGVAVCPVLTGAAIADLSLMGGSCGKPDGKANRVWSLFGTPGTYPQPPDWVPAAPVNRAFTTTSKPGGGFSNMWSFPCVVRPVTVNGVKLADCYGPMNESPWTGQAVPLGSTIGTAAPVGAPNPVGGNFP